MNMIHVGTQRLEVPANYLGWWPGMQGNTETEVTDRSGFGRHLTKTAGATWNNNASTGIWEVANYFSAQENATAYWAELANAVFAAWDYSSGDSLLLAWRGLITTPAATSRFLGNSVGSTVGFCARIYTSHLVDFQLAYGATPTVLTFPAAGGTASAWGAASPTEAHYAVAIDAQEKKLYAFKNGSVDANVNGLVIGDGITPYDFRAPSNPFRFGGAGSSGGISASFRDFHMVTKRGGFANLPRAVEFLANTRFMQIPLRLI